jgi:hypothetical protein
MCAEDLFTPMQLLKLTYTTYLTQKFTDFNKIKKPTFPGTGRPMAHFKFIRRRKMSALFIEFWLAQDEMGWHVMAWYRMV